MASDARTVAHLVDDVVLVFIAQDGTNVVLIVATELRDVPSFDGYPIVAFGDRLKPYCLYSYETIHLLDRPFQNFAPNFVLFDAC